MKYVTNLVEILGRADEHGDLSDENVTALRAAFWDVEEILVRLASGSGELCDPLDDAELDDWIESLQGCRAWFRESHDGDREALALAVLLDAKGVRDHRAFRLREGPLSRGYEKVERMRRIGEFIKAARRIGDEGLASELTEEFIRLSRECAGGLRLMRAAH